jgi:hypothetical protein
MPFQFDGVHVVGQRNGEHCCLALDAERHAKRVLRDGGSKAVLKQVYDFVERGVEDVDISAVEETDHGGETYSQDGEGFVRRKPVEIEFRRKPWYVSARNAGMGSRLHRMRGTGENARD